MEEPLSRTITNLRKEGKLQEAWDLACPAVQENPDDTYLKGAFFWVCYGFLKQVQVQIKSRALENESNFKPNQGELERINFLLDWVIWLDIPPGGYEYRSLLLLFQRCLESVPKLALLLVKYGNTLFEKEDQKPYQGEKGESPSLMLTFARKVAKAWIENDEVKQVNVDHLLSIFEQVRTKAKDTQHMIWLDYDEAKLLIIAGRNDEARKLIIPVLKKKQSESWAWGALAATYRRQDADTAICLFAQGICCAHDEKFSLKLLKGIAPLLASKGFNKEASMCVKRTVDCYERNGWKVKPDVEQLTTQPWFDPNADPAQLASFLRTKSKGALEHLHGPTTTAVGLVFILHQSGKGLHLYLSEHERISVPLRLFKGKQKPELGDYAEVSLSGEGSDKTVIAAQLTSAKQLPGVEIVQGALRVTEKGFGFVDKTFVPHFLINKEMDGQTIDVLRVKDYDKKKNEMGWKAVTVVAR